MACENTRVRATLDCLPASGLRSGLQKKSLLREIANVSRGTTTPPGNWSLSTHCARFNCGGSILSQFCSCDRDFADSTCLYPILIAIRLEYPHSQQKARQQRGNDRARTSFRPRRRRGLRRHLQSRQSPWTPIIQTLRRTE